MPDLPPPPPGYKEASASLPPPPDGYAEPEQFKPTFMSNIMLGVTGLSKPQGIPQQKIDDFRMRFFNTPRMNNIPGQTAIALAKNPSDPVALARLRKFNPVAQIAVTQKAKEIAPQYNVRVKYQPAGPGAMPILENTRTGDVGPTMPLGPDEALAQAIRGPEGASQLAGKKGFGPAAERFGYSLLTPQNLAMLYLGGGVGGKLLAALSGAFGVSAGKGAIDKYVAGDTGGAAFDAILSGLLLGHGVKSGFGAPPVDEAAVAEALARAQRYEGAPPPQHLINEVGRTVPVKPPLPSPKAGEGATWEPAINALFDKPSIKPGYPSLQDVIDAERPNPISSVPRPATGPHPTMEINPEFRSAEGLINPPENGPLGDLGTELQREIERITQSVRPGEKAAPESPAPVELNPLFRQPEVDPGTVRPGVPDLQAQIDALIQAGHERGEVPAHAPPTGPHATMEIDPAFQKAEPLINPPDAEVRTPETSVRTDVSPTERAPLAYHEEIARGFHERQGYGQSVKSDLAAANRAVEDLKLRGYDTSDVEAALADHSEIKRSDYARGEDGQQEYESDKGEAWVAVADAIDSLEEPEVIQGQRGFRDRLQSEIDSTRQSIIDDLKQSGLNAGMNPILMAKVVKLGTYHLAATGMDFAAWSAKMVADVGPTIKPHLKAIWKQVTAAQNGLPTAAGAAIAGEGTGRFAASYEHAGPLTGNAVNKLAVATDLANFEALQAKRNVMQGLTPKQQQDLGDFLVSERLKKVNPQHPQILTPAEETRIASDPAIQRALAVHRTQVAPAILKARVETGMDPNVVKNDPFFVSLVPEDAAGVGTGASGSVASRLRRQRTRFANKATGTADLYTTDLGKIYETSFKESLPKAALRDVYKAIANEGKLSRDYQPGYKGIEVDKIPGENPGEFRITQRYVPEPVARDIEDARNVGKLTPDRLHNILDASQRFFTGMALTANPAEMVGHTHRQLSALSKVPPANASVISRIAEPIANLVSGGTNAGTKGGALLRLMSDDMSTQENQQIMREIMQAGGGTSRAFRHYTVSNIPGIGKIQGAAHDLLFSIPEGKGIKGYDMRVRVALEKIRRQVEGNTDPQRIRDFANQLGQYTDKPAKTIELLKKFNPYLATQMPMRATELRQLAGVSGLKADSAGQQALLHMETLLRGTAGTVGGFIIANRALSGKWPWENEAGHETDLNTGKKDKAGKTIYIKGGKMEPGTMRALTTVGVPALMKESKARGKADYISAGEVGAANALLSIAAGDPRTNVLSALVGKAPYLTKQPGKPIDVLSVRSKPPRGRKQGTQNLLDALKSLNPAFERIPTGEKHSTQGEADLGNPALQYLLGQYTGQGKR